MLEMEVELESLGLGLGFQESVQSFMKRDSV